MQVAIALFPRMTALDAIGPYEVLQRVPSLDVRRGDRTGVILVPGGQGTRELLDGGPPGLGDTYASGHPLHDLGLQRLGQPALIERRAPGRRPASRSRPAAAAASAGR